MLKITSLLLSFFLFFSLSAQTLSIPANSSVYAIDVAERGTAIISMFSYLYNTKPPISKTNSFVIGLETTTGFLQQIRSIIGTANNTILIVNYGPINSSISSFTAVLPVEQIVELVYKAYDTIFLPTMTTYMPGTPNNTVPYYSINTAQRAADIVSAFNILNPPPSSGSLYNQFKNPQFNIQTTLNGDFYSSTPSSTITNGLILNVQAISRSGNTFLLVNYPKNTNPGNFVVVEPNQISSITYIRQ